MKLQVGKTQFQTASTRNLRWMHLIQDNQHPPPPTPNDCQTSDLCISLQPCFISTANSCYGHVVINQSLTQRIGTSVSKWIILRTKLETQSNRGWGGEHQASLTCSSTWPAKRITSSCLQCKRLNWSPGVKSRWKRSRWVWMTVCCCQLMRNKCNLNDFMWWNTAMLITWTSDVHMSLLTWFLMPLLLHRCRHLLSVQSIEQPKTTNKPPIHDVLWLSASFQMLPASRGISFGV